MKTSNNYHWTIKCHQTETRHIVLSVNYEVVWDEMVDLILDNIVLFWDEINHLTQLRCCQICFFCFISLLCFPNLAILNKTHIVWWLIFNSIKSKVSWINAHEWIYHNYQRLCLNWLAYFWSQLLGETLDRAGQWSCNLIYNYTNLQPPPPGAALTRIGKLTCTVILY